MAVVAAVAVRCPIETLVGRVQRERRAVGEAEIEVAGQIGGQDRRVLVGAVVLTLIGEQLDRDLRPFVDGIGERCGLFLVQQRLFAFRSKELVDAAATRSASRIWVLARRRLT
jgi:hypothetical protein